METVHHQNYLLSALKELLQTSYTSVEDIYNLARRYYASQNQPVAAYLCSYLPVEILRAGGLQTLRIIGTGSPVSSADLHLQSYACHLVRSVVDIIENENLKFINGLIFSHSCDSMQSLPDIIKTIKPDLIVETLMIPVQLQSEIAGHFLHQELQDFINRIENHFNTSITIEAIAQEIRQSNRLRSKLQQFVHQTGLNHLTYLLRLSAQIFPVDFTLTLIEELTETISHEQSPAGRKKLILSGSVILNMEIYTLLEELGVKVVWEDLCVGDRLLSHRINEEKEPLTALTEYLMDKIPCPCKHTAPNRRFDHLLKKIHELKANGVLFLPLKFCDPFFFDLPELQNYLSSNNVASTTIEIDPQGISFDALRTRLQAFIESL